MEQRQAAHHHVLRSDLQQRARRHLGVAGQPAVRQFCALGLTGGSRRVQHHGRVGVVAFDRLRLPGQIGDQGCQPGVIDKPGLRVHRRRPAVGGIGEQRVGEQALRTGIAEVELDLTRLQQRIHRYRDGAAAHDAVVGHREGGAVGQHQSDTVAGLDSVTFEQRGNPCGGVVEFGVGVGQVVAAQRGLVGMFAGRFNKIPTQIRHDGPLQRRGSWTRQ